MRFSSLRILFKKRSPQVPDPGQKIQLLVDDGSWSGGYRAVSPPLTTEEGESAVLIAEEEEVRAARWEMREPRGTLWSVSKVRVPRHYQRQARRRLKKPDKHPR